VRNRFEDEEDDKKYELELGTGGILALFMTIAVIAGIFFAFGYTMGKHATPATLSPSDAATGSLAVGGKPLPSVPAPAAANGAASASPPSPADLSAAESNQTPASLQPAASNPPAGPSSGANSPSAAASASSKPMPGAAPAQSMAKSPVLRAISQPVDSSSTAVNSGSAPPPKPRAAAPKPSDDSPAVGAGFAVQVLASSKQEDALSLAAALKSRQYPVFVIGPGSGSADQLYHVEVGPFGSQHEASDMQAHLRSDGYQAIVKKL
jgi:cell division septation protein DedD